MEAISVILTNIGLGICGFLFYSLWNSRKYFTDKSENWVLTKFVMENLQTWVFNTIIITLVAIIVYNVPEVFEAVQELSGLELSDKTPGGFFTFGLLLIPFTKK